MRLGLGETLLWRLILIFLVLGCCCCCYSSSCLSEEEEGKGKGEREREEREEEKEFICVEYILENECGSVLGNVTIEENEQENYFEESVSLNVSDVRMIPHHCRRKYLSYYCKLMFGGFFL